MSKKKKIFIILGSILGITLLYFLGSLAIVYFFGMGFNDQYDITTNVEDYQKVIGSKAEGQYQDKWNMSEEIFPKTIKDLNVEEFKMVYYDPWDKQFLSYLVIDYDEDDYQKEVSRLQKIGIDSYKGYYGVTGFQNYSLLAMNADSYSGFVYAITDDESRIIYVEIIFCNYYMDIKYQEQIPKEYLPDGFDATIDNAYGEKMRK